MQYKRQPLGGSDSCYVEACVCLFRFEVIYSIHGISMELVLIKNHLVEKSENQYKQDANGVNRQLRRQ